MKIIIKQDGYFGLYKGVQARMLWSSLFGAVGFYSFEMCKKYLEVSNDEITT
jgi:hypothetical protein